MIPNDPNNPRQIYRQRTFADAVRAALQQSEYTGSDPVSDHWAVYCDEEVLGHAIECGMVDETSDSREARYIKLAREMNWSLRDLGNHGWRRF